MSVEKIKQDLLAEAILAETNYKKSRNSEQRDRAARIRRIVSNLDSLGSSGVTSFNTRTGAVTLTSSDVITALGYTPSSGTPTLDQVTTAGNTTANGISIGSIAVDTDLIYTDTVNNRVGIGTTSPTEVLHVEGDGMVLRSASYADSGFTISDDIYDYRIGTVPPQLRTNYIHIQRNASNTLFRHSSGAFKWLNLGSEKMQLTSGGNLLVGTTTDNGYKLQVNGDATINGVQVGLGGGSVSSNTVVGSSALNANTTGSRTIAIGENALRLNTTGANQVAIGWRTLYRNSTGTANQAFGYRALENNTTGNENIAVGYQTLQGNISGGSNVGVGNAALYFNTASFNVAIGGGAAYNNIIGANITAVGTSSLRNNTASNNVAVGYEAAYSNTSGAGQTALGYRALKSNTSQYNTALGYQAMENATAADSVAVGVNALRAASGFANNAIGLASLVNTTTGTHNLAIGRATLFTNTIGERNIAIGNEAGYSNLVGSGNVFLGYQAGYNETDSDKLYIGNSSTNTLIYGDFSTGNVSIGSTVDAGYKLDVNGTLRAQGDIIITNGRYRLGGAQVGLYATRDLGLTVDTGSGNSFFGYYATGDTSYAGTTVTLGRLSSVNLNAVSGLQEMVRITGNYAPTSGTGLFTALQLSNTINQTGGANGITRGLYVNPTLTSAADFRAIETTSGKVIHQGLTNSTQSDVVYYDSTTGELTYGASPAGATPTLDAVTTAGNTTTNTISVARTSITTTDTYKLSMYEGGGGREFHLGVGNGYGASARLRYLSGPSTITAEITLGNDLVFDKKGSGGTIFRDNAIEKARFANSTGNLLLGTTTDAGYKLDVNGTGRFTSSTSASALTAKGYHTSTGTAFLVQNSYPVDILRVDNNGALTYNGSQLSMFSSFPLGDHVPFMLSHGGYGTATPDNSTISTAYRGRQAGGYNSYDYFKYKIYTNTPDTNVTTGFEWWTHQDQVSSVGSQFAMSLRGQNLGIGTTAPTEKLHVDGNVKIGGGSTLATKLYIVGTGNRGMYIQAYSDGYGSAGAAFRLANFSVGSFRFDANVLPYQYFQQNLGNGTEPWGAVYAQTFKGRDNAAEGTTYLSSGTSSNPLILQMGGTEYMRLAATTGNLLIGTTTDAGYKLDVNGSVRFGDGTPYLQVTSTAVEVLGSYLFANKSSGVSFYAYESVFRGLIRSDSAGGSVLKLGDTQERMRITGGNVGIGTTAPSSKLQLGEDASTLGSNVFTMYRGGSTGQYTTIENQGGTVYKSYGVGGHVFYHDPAQEAMRVAATTGNLLVGTATDAGYRLDVQGGDARFAQNVEASTYSVAGNAGYSGIINFPSNPPGSQNLEYLHGILINVF